jgi:hypothetical protein
MTRKTAVPVTTRSLVQRINRKLVLDSQKLMTCKKSNHWFEDLGSHYIVDMSRNQLVSKHVDLEEFGRKVEALQPWEKLA